MLGHREIGHLPVAGSICRWDSRSTSEEFMPEDFRPKPLLIYKREPQSCSIRSSAEDMSDSAPSFYTAEESNDNAACISRRASVLSKASAGHTSESTASFDTSSQQRLSPSPLSFSTLRVRKKRRSVTRLSTSGTDAYHAPPPTTATECTLHARYLCKEQRHWSPTVSRESRPTTPRALTIGGDYRIGVASQSWAKNDVLTTSTSRVAPPREYKRTASETGPVSRDPASSNTRTLGEHNDYAIDLGQHRLTKHASFRHRFLNRLVSGLTMNLGQTTPDHKKTIAESRRSTDLTFENACNVLPRTRARASTNSTSSCATESSWGSKFDDTIASFPTPPKSLPISTLNSEGHSAPQRRRHDISKLYEDTSSMGANLNLVPEREHMDVGGGKNLFVAVQVTGCSDGPYSVSMSNRYGLDVAVLVDNSIFTSPTSLMTSCELATYIASILNHEDDRMAILCTNPLFLNDPGSDVVIPLGSVNTNRTKLALDSIAGSQEMPALELMNQALEHANDLLLRSLENESTSTKNKRNMPHVLILTANPGAFRSHAFKGNSIQEHLISPGALPWKHSRVEHRNGWIFHQYQPIDMSDPIDIREQNAGDLRSGLRQLVSQARCGVTLQSLSELELSINAGPYCSIQGIMGETSFSTLQPGEVRTILVKVKVDAIPFGASMLSSFPQGSRTSSGSLDLEKELEALLGTGMVKVLSATLRYQHSALPEGTVCELRREVTLKIPVIERERLSPDVELSIDNREYKKSTLVQKWLIYYLATHHSPDDALAILKREFGKDGLLCTSPDYVKLVTEELKYQARIVERYEMIYPEGFGLVNKIHVSSDKYGDNPIRKSGTQELDDILPLSETAIFRSKHRRRRPSSASLIRKASKETIDEARQIWNELRRKSKGEKHLDGVGRKFPRSESSAETIKQIKELALRNKRSVGQDTLKSIYRTREAENVAPWL